MRSFTFRVAIPYQTFLTHYMGAASSLVIQSEQGPRLQLPANRFRPYLKHCGINGRFTVIIDENNKIKQISKLD
ncbi:DUF2835 family protein [Thaumasiovibrio sp. DFM-14]|uniref:DUF2835 family protein n=1 Tax=Thaumasiovibrio sp. DFM-14 TaxID=3384792 RepID=UPI0039A2ED52